MPDRSKDRSDEELWNQLFHNFFVSPTVDSAPITARDTERNQPNGNARSYEGPISPSHAGAGGIHIDHGLEAARLDDIGEEVLAQHNALAQGVILGPGAQALSDQIDRQFRTTIESMAQDQAAQEEVRHEVDVLQSSGSNQFEMRPDMRLVNELAAIIDQQQMRVLKSRTPKKTECVEQVLEDMEMDKPCEVCHEHICKCVALPIQAPIQYTLHQTASNSDGSLSYQNIRRRLNLN